MRVKIGEYLINTEAIAYTECHPNAFDVRFIGHPKEVTFTREAAAALEAFLAKDAKEVMPCVDPAARLDPLRAQDEAVGRFLDDLTRLGLVGGDRPVRHSLVILDAALERNGSSS